MPRIDTCDGGCGELLRSNTTDIIIRRAGERSWKRHKLCDKCAARNVFVLDKNGRYVSESGFTSDVLR